MGMNRASLGVQDTNLIVPKAVHRGQSNEINRTTVARLRDAGITAINLDFIYGLPRQTPETVATTVDEVHELAPDRLSVCSYAHLFRMSEPGEFLIKRAECPTQRRSLPGLG